MIVAASTPVGEVAERVPVAGACANPADVVEFVRD
jgi:hypothetical protein